MMDAFASGEFCVYQGVVTAFPMNITLDDILAFDIFPDWEGNNRDWNLAYIQHPLEEIEIIIDDSSFYLVTAHDEKNNISPQQPPTHLDAH